MFLSESDTVLNTISECGVVFEKITGAAQDDLREFLRANFGALEIWSEALRESQNIDPEFPHCRDIVEFAEALLPWLDERKLGKKPPWIPTDGTSKLDPNKAQYIGDFLDDLKYWLDYLVFPQGKVPIKVNEEDSEKIALRETDSDEVNSAPPNAGEAAIEETEAQAVDPEEMEAEENGVLSVRLPQFGKFIAGRWLPPHQWEVFFVEIRPEWRDIIPQSGFISWLIVSPASSTRTNNNILIIYDKEKIEKDCRLKLEDIRIRKETNSRGEEIVRLKEEISRRTEKIFIHEIAHGRTFLKWYLAKLNQLRIQQPELHWWDSGTVAGGRLIGSPAVSEFYAWAYTFAFRNCVMSTRCWITRILSNSDEEWRNL
jgi:hypothetical protein